MARKKRGTKNKAERKVERGGETTPLENHQPDQEEDGTKNVTAQLKSLLSKSTDSNPADQNVPTPGAKQSKPSPNEATTVKQDDRQVSKVRPVVEAAGTSASKEPVISQEQDSSLRLSGITSFGAALHNVLKLIEGIIPERYRSKLSHLVALVIVLIVLACIAWTFRHILIGVPDVYVTFKNKSDQISLVPRYVRAQIVDHSGQEIDGYPLQIRITQVQAAEDRNFLIVDPNSVLKIRLTLPKTAALYKIYEEGNVYLALQFFLDPSYENPKYVSHRFLFSKKGLRPPPIILDSDPYLDEPGIYVFFEIDPNTEPHCRENLKSDMEELEIAAREMFWVTTRTDYEQAREKIDSDVKKNEPSIGIENLASWDQAFSTMVRITIIGYIQIGSRMKWAFDLDETQNRIRDMRVSVDCGPTLTDIAKKKILSELQQTIVDYCGIRGAIFEIIPPSNGGDNYVAILDIGSFMGVQKDMVFNVLSKGTANLPCGTVTITKVTPQSTWGAEGSLNIKIEKLSKHNFIDYEDYCVERPPKL